MPRLNVDVKGFAVLWGRGSENGPNDIFSKTVPTNLYFRKVGISFWNGKFIFLQYIQELVLKHKRHGKGKSMGIIGVS